MLFGGLAVNAATVIDSQGIEYTVGNVDPTTGYTQATVSSNNKNLFNAFTGTITIPASFEKDGVTYLVTAIDKYAFEATPITGAIIETTITEIPSFLFRDCTSLASVTYPQSVTTIGDYAFGNCSSLKSPIDEGIRQIRSYAFSGCTNLGDVKIPSTLTSLGQAAFYKSTITSLNWAESREGTLAISSNCFREVTGFSDLTVPSYVKEIQGYAFMGSALEIVDLSGMSYGASIGQYAFDKNNSLTELKMPASVDLGPNAFSNCNALTTITWPENATFTGGYYAFAYCNGLESVALPEGITELPGGFFRKCSSLADVSLPPSLLKISKLAFYQCHRLNSIVLPPSLGEIGESAFEQCQLLAIELPASLKALGLKCFASNVLTDIKLSEDIDGENIDFGSSVFADNRSLTSFSFPKWMTTVPSGIFRNCTHLATVENFNPTDVKGEAFSGCSVLRLPDGLLPESIATIGNEAFRHCGSDLYGSNFIDELIIDGVATIGNGAFDGAKIGSLSVMACDDYLNDPTKFGKNVLANNTTIQTIAFSECITRIPDGFCKGWQALTSVEWPTGLVELGDEAFANCPNLNIGVIDFANGLPWSKIKAFGNNALQNTGITSVVWPAEKPDQTYGRGLFENNSGLTKANIPAWMHEIPGYFFKFCRNITELIWEKTRDTEKITVGPFAFGDLSALAEIKFPDVEVELGEYSFGNCSTATFSWPEKKVTLADKAFKDCSRIEFEEFPEYITAIPQECFSGCSGLKKLTVGEQITDIESGAFYYCQNLAEVDYRCNVPRIPTSMFQNCSALKSITFANNIETIDSYCFMGCTALSDINWSDSQIDLKSMGGNVFVNCTALERFIEHVSASTSCNSNIFEGTSSLKVIAFPASIGYSEFRTSDNALRSIEFKSYGNFNFQGCSDFHAEALLGVSTNPIKLTGIGTFRGNTSGKEKKGVLMVARGDRWRYEEAGYNKIWDIREYRPAETAISGTIHSQFKEGDCRNQYTSYLSWEVNLCDLNPDGETTYTLWRRGNTDVDPTKVATLHIEQPHTVETGVNDLNVVTSDPLVVAKVQVESPDGTMKDKESIHTDFDFLTGEDLYEMKSSNQHGSLYFNPSTTRRVGVSEAMGTESRLLFIDRFASPDLNGEEGPVPDYYEYYVTASAFEYDEPVNNDNYDVDPATGLAYHLEHRTREAFTSEVCRVYTPMALPSLQFNGIYSTEEVMADTDGTLRDSNLYNDRGEIKLNYSYHPDVIRHREKENSTTKYVVQNITCYQIDNDTKDRLLSQTVNHDSPNGTVTTREIKPNTTFQMVTETFARGTFGSRAVHVYGAPTLQLSAGAFQVLGWDGHSHPEGAISSKLQLIPDVSQMGYTGDKLTLNAANHRFGLWRTTTVTAPETPLMTAADGEGAACEVLVNHFAGPVEENFTSECETCAALRGYDPETLSYTDIIAAAPDYGGKVHADYRGRLYVQLADDPYHWMVAEARATPPYEHTNGIDDIPSEIPGDAVFYDLQGRRVVNPAHGEILIMVTSRGSYKIRY